MLPLAELSLKSKYIFGPQCKFDFFGISVAELNVEKPVQGDPLAPTGNRGVGSAASPCPQKVMPLAALCCI